MEIHPGAMLAENGINILLRQIIWESGREDVPLEMKINEDSRTVEVWLNTREAQDPVLKECLRQLCRIFAAQRYLVAVFQSGGQDLAQTTSDLLRCNRQRAARLEVEREKQTQVAR